jgi:anti-anti-sigma factor
MSELRYRYLKTNIDQGVLILTLSPSRLEGDGMAQTIVEEMQAAVALAGADKVVFNLEHVQYLTSANFRPFLSLRKHLMEMGGDMVICNLSPPVLDIFQVTRLVRTTGSGAVIFETQPDVAAAVAFLLRAKEAHTAPGA